ncbi:MAG: hypothetical protein IIA87_03070 [Nanoarchaeota archaeon]|nr:hypothetical protein [Nanoarchaeota archaeon]
MLSSISGITGFIIAEDSSRPASGFIGFWLTIGGIALLALQQGREKQGDKQPWSS